MKFFCVVEMLFLIAIIVTSFISKKYVTGRFRYLYAVPLLITIIMFIRYGFIMSYLGVYISSILIITGLFTDKEILKRSIASFCTLAIFISLFIGSFIGVKMIDYEADFEEAFAVMKEHYVLTKEKGIDWDALYAEYKPLFEKVNETQDSVENYKTWMKFAKEFYDGHTNYILKKTDDQIKIMMEAYGNDYGLSFARLSTGEFVAINVEGYDNSYSIESEDTDLMGFYRYKNKYLDKDAEDNKDIIKNAGIKNGTVITKWNGKPIDDYFDEVTYYINPYPVRENEEFYLPMYVAGIGADCEYGNCDGEYAIVSFLDENGVEKEVKLESLGSYMPRLYDSISKIDSGLNITNLSWENVNEDTMILRVRAMAYDSASYADPSQYTEMTDQLRKEVVSLKENGYKNLIIDLRANEGGDPFFVQNVAGLFAPEGEHVNLYSTVINEKTATFERNEDGRYPVKEALTYEGEDLWHDGKIILLVNAECVSAGDDMTYIMGEYPNVRVIGFTSTNSSCQAVTAVDLEIGQMAFSAVPNVNANGEVVIDTLTDHAGRTPFDVRIPFSKEAINAIFDKGEDYPLNYAVGQFNIIF